MRRWGLVGSFAVLALSACGEPVGNVSEANVDINFDPGSSGNGQAGDVANGGSGNLAAAPSACARPPRTGAHLAGRRLAGSGHKLEINNGTGSDAIVKLRAAESNRLVSAFFVARNSSAALRGIPDGQYIVQFATGPGLAEDCRTLARIDSTGEFPDRDRLVTERTPVPDGVRVRTMELSYTLHSVEGGTIQPMPLDPSAFNRD